MRNRYLITYGDPDREEPEVLATCSESELEPNLRHIAENHVKEKDDVTRLRVWSLTPVEVTTKAFEILGLEKL